jgi:hypothetical protein
MEIWQMPNCDINALSLKFKIFKIIEQLKIRCFNYQKLHEEKINKLNTSFISELTPFFFFLIRIVGGGVHIGCPRGTAAMYWHIVPVPGDCEDGEVGGMKLVGRGNRSTRRKPVPAPLCPPQIPLARPGMEPGLPRWEANDRPLELWRGLTSRMVAGSIPDEVIQYFQFISSFQGHYVLGVNSASNRNEYQESSWG